MLLKDLAPAAEAAGYRVVYASFWQSPLSPIAVLLHALEQVLVRKSFAERLQQFFTSPVTRLKLSGGLPGASGQAEIDLTEIKGPAPDDLLLYLDDLFGRLAGKNKRLLLLLDEVQELAQNPGNRPLVAALRTCLDQYKDGVAVVFTGSSRSALTQMFSDREAPFFHFATQIELPPLDAHFVHHVLQAFTQASGRRLDEADALEAFRLLHHNPLYFRKLIEIILANPAIDVKQAIPILRLRLPVEQGFVASWLGLRAIDRAVLLQISQQTAGLYALETRRHIGASLTGKAPSKAEILGALRRLLADGLIVRTKRFGEYVIEDDEFAEWVKTQQTAF